MTPKSLFNIILKIFGLFFLKEMALIIPGFISLIEFYISTPNPGEWQSNSIGILPIIMTLITLAFYVFILYQVLFNSNKIIDILKLDKGFDQKEFSFNISSSLILTIVLIVIGGVILMNEVPNFFRNVFSYFQEKNLTRGSAKPDFSYIIISGVKIIIGLLFIGERKRFVAFVEKRQASKEKEEREFA